MTKEDFCIICGDFGGVWNRYKEDKKEKYLMDRLTGYLKEVKQKTAFKKWFFGHYHDNRNVSAQEILLYEQIIRIS